MPDSALDDLLLRPAHELAQLVRAGAVGARELTQAALARIEALNPRLNAFVHVNGGQALAVAQTIAPGDERPFAGVPIALKEFVPARGLPLTFSSHLFGDYVARHDAHVVTRLRRAGFVIVGVTNAPEIGLLPVTEPRRFGPARNPWDLTRTPGGSSGGSAAAVAAGMVPIAHGSDGGGSIRIPAACCGLVGLKPSRNRISSGPDQGDAYFTTNGVLTTTVRDTALALDALAGYEPGDANWLPPPPAPFASLAAVEPQRLRVGLALRPPLDVAVDPVGVQAAREAAALLADLGHDVEEIDPPWVTPRLLELFTTTFATLAAMAVVLGEIVSGRAARAQDVEPLTWAVYRHARETDALSYLSALTQLQAIARSIVARLAPYEVVVTPALAERPVPIGTIDAQSDDPLSHFRRSGEFTPFTALANATGQPAISLPLSHAGDGLPVGVHLIGAPAGEATLLAVAAQLEAARPWAHRRPAWGD